jgi:hypothetical protein
MQAMLDDGLVKRWLVVAPKRVCTDVWPVEAPLWSRIAPALAVGTPAQRNAALASAASVVVTNYDNLDKLTDLSGFDGIVFDELTRLKNPSGKRFKALEKLLEPVKVRWGLTGWAAPRARSCSSISSASTATSASGCQHPARWNR